MNDILVNSPFLDRINNARGTTQLSTLHGVIMLLWCCLSADRYHARGYHLLERNCNHFSNELCMALVNQPTPSWVNRMANSGARVGSFLTAGLAMMTQMAVVATAEMEQAETRNGQCSSETPRFEEID